ncbi:MAG: hypothetical protein OXC40_04765 [Proteobacteria bacterium]|nr:hypothetical protein [Pseudomonadota bacterium]
MNKKRIRNVMIFLLFFTLGFCTPSIVSRLSTIGDIFGLEAELERGKNTSQNTSQLSKYKKLYQHEATKACRGMYLILESNKKPYSSVALIDLQILNSFKEHCLSLGAP